MGNGPSVEIPTYNNTCTDPEDIESTNIVIENFCTNGSQANLENFVDNQCHIYGGTVPPQEIGNPNNNPYYSYEDPEWVHSSTGGNCTYDDSSGSSKIPGTSLSGGGCESADGGCGINGTQGFCTKIQNTGDPLICALSDYQCNSNNNDPKGVACFSNSIRKQTCNKDFRAPDTDAANYLLTQFCLGNIPGAIQNSPLPVPIPGGTGMTGGVAGIDFTSLWTNPSNPISSDQNNIVPWTIIGTPLNTIFQAASDIQNDENNDTPCIYNPTSGITTSCSTSRWTPGTANAPSKYLPAPDPYTFTNLPPCQQIFWRTLYGNNPTFHNQYWRPFGNTAICSNGSDTCVESSALPQADACAAIPFVGTPTPTGEAFARNMLQQAVNKFTNGLQGNLIGGFSDQLDQGFTNWLVSVCSEYPQLCSGFLKTTCKNATPELLKVNPLAAQWCGCYMPDEQYSSYINNFGLSKQCTPYCAAGDVIPLYDANTNTPLTCDQGVCIIDDVTINLAKTKFAGSGNGGNLNFNQICNGCSPAGSNGLNSNTVNSTGNNSGSRTVGGNIDSFRSSTINTGISTNQQIATSSNANINCRCIISGYNLTTIGSVIQGGVNISQACNGNVQCYNSVKLNGGGEQQNEIDCHGGSTNTNDVIKEAEAALVKKANNTSNAWIILIIFIVIFIIIILWVLINPRGIPEKDLIYTKETIIPEPVIPQSLASISSNLIQTNYYGTQRKPHKPKFF
jgi:hypothetical protein